MQMNDENIQTEEIKQAAEPEFKFPEDAESTLKTKRDSRSCDKRNRRGNKHGTLAEHRQET